MKPLFTLLAAIISLTVGYSQDIEQKLRSFDKIVVSPKINLVLIPGDTESIRIIYSNVHPSDIIIDQTGRRVHIYLEDAKIIDKGERRDNMFERRERYRHALVTAYVTFRHLRLIETRGEEEVYCEGKIISDRLKLRAYGAAEIRLSYVEAGKFKARLFGENKMKVLEGEAGHINYKLYGENKVDTKGLQSVTSSTTIYGEGRLSLYASEEVRLNSIGEPALLISGAAVISKGVIIGRTNIKRN